MPVVARRLNGRSPPSLRIERTSDQIGLRLMRRERQRAILERAARHFDAGELRVVVGATFSLEQATDAHRALEAGQVTGKAVLVM